MLDYSLTFPEGFDDYAWEVESKGWFGEARLTFVGKRYCLIFYDPTRLSQEIDSELKRKKAFFEPNLLVVHSVTRPNMEMAVELLIREGGVRSLTAEHLPNGKEGE